MAGRGPAPKDPNRRARRNQDTTAVTVIEFEPTPQPDLPPLPEGIEWCQQTVDWWAMWAESPLSANYGATDWAFLADTALIHQDVWGFMNLDRLPELRLRVAKFGATPEDRARLRIQFAEADERDNRRERKSESARERRRNISVVTPIGSAKTG